MILIGLFSDRSLYYVMKKETSGRRIMHLLRQHNYWGEVWGVILNRLLSLHERTFIEPASTVSYGSIADPLVTPSARQQQKQQQHIQRNGCGRDQWPGTGLRALDERGAAT